MGPMRPRLWLVPVLLLATLAGCRGCSIGPTIPHRVQGSGLPSPRDPGTRVLPEGFAERLSQAALARTRHKVRYDGSYLRIPYPMGDVPKSIGVCTDVVVRAYRALGIDLQKEVHEDMSRNFRLYPDKWGLKAPDTNIDHRRVLNLEVFFQRHGLEVAATSDPDDYLPGDLVTWTVHVNRPHIGIVVDKRSSDGKRPLVVHNIGWGPQLEDVLFDYPVVGHFRYAGPEDKNSINSSLTPNRNTPDTSRITPVN